MGKKRRISAGKEPIYIYVSTEAKSDFTAYAVQYGLDETALANLLIAREERVGRLPRLSKATLEPSARTEKIVVHLAPERRQRFVRHVDDLGYSVSEAGALLVIDELQQKWLERCVGIDSD